MTETFLEPKNSDIIIETVLNRDQKARTPLQYVTVAELLRNTGVWKDHSEIEKTVLGSQLAAPGACFAPLMVGWASCDFWYSPSPPKPAPQLAN
jgi:hypothetical protein